MHAAASGVYHHDGVYGLLFAFRIFIIAKCLANYKDILFRLLACLVTASFVLLVEGAGWVGVPMAVGELPS